LPSPLYIIRAGGRVKIKYNVGFLSWLIAAPRLSILQQTKNTNLRSKSKMRKLLFTRESPEIQPLRELIEKQTHRTLAMWVIDCAPRVLQIFESRHFDPRPRQAVEAARAWMHGEIKMPIARRTALAAHNAATAVEDDPAACAAARAMGHVVGTIHTETHALGLVFYGLTAFVRAADPMDADAVTSAQLQWLYDRLLYWQDNADKENTKWAPFLLREGQNKEKLLREKYQNKSK
jgi:hypothetical protein